MARIGFLFRGFGRAVAYTGRRSVRRSVTRGSRAALAGGLALGGGGGSAEGLAIRIIVDDEEARRELAQLGLHLSDLRNFWPLVVPLATDWWGEQFETEGRFGSGGWSPLAPSTVLSKQLRGLRPNILQATGKLRQDASRPRREQTSRSLTLTIDNEYLPFHQFGTENMPARPLIFERLPAQAERDLQDAAETYVRDILDRF